MKLNTTQRSEAARRAARKAHRTMKSAAYQSAKKRGTVAVQSFLAARRKAA
jgi:hypothetical protein